ncbi:MAG: IPT/TIG domain-containing protein [Myxococcota bacterium]
MLTEAEHAIPITLRRCVPPGGPTGGGYEVVIEGQGFEPGLTVKVGHRPATVVRVEPESLTVTVGPSMPGTVAVVLTRPDGSVATLPEGFEYHAPRLDAVAPTSASAGAEQVVLITGDYFAPGCRVYFDGAQSSHEVWDSPTDVRAMLPIDLVGKVDVRIQNPDGVYGDLPQGFEFHPPTITKLSATRGPTAGGTRLTITGTHFNGKTWVEFGGVNVTDIERLSTTQLRVRIPPGPEGPVSVAVGNSNVAFDELPDAYTYHAPRIDALMPKHGIVAGGTTVRIEGEYFERAKYPKVEFGTVPAKRMFMHRKLLYVRAPPGVGPGTVDVKVTGSDGQSAVLPGCFTYGEKATMGTDEVDFLMDGEQYFGELRTQMMAVAAAQPGPHTYVRLAYWMINASVYLGDRTHYGNAQETLVEHVARVIMAGHDVDIIVWYPNFKDRFKEGHHAQEHARLADALMVKDAIAATAAAAKPPPDPLPGRVRVYLERYEGVTGSSNHEKIAIFSVGGQRTAIVGGFNLANYYWDCCDHRRHMNDPQKKNGWHDTAVRVVGPGTDAIEAEWMRRWNRAVAMQAATIPTARLTRQVRTRYVGAGSRSTLRAAAVRIEPNDTPQTVTTPTTTTAIRLTRSTTLFRHRDLRDEILARISAAKHYIYMENNQFTDPEIVRALYQAWQANPALRIRILTNIGTPGGFGLMTRRSWLQLILRMPPPICQRVFYMSKSNPNEQRDVDRVGASVWNVIDSYDGSTGATLQPHQRWLLGDGLEITKENGRGTKTVPFTRITAVEGTFHFYTPVRFGAPPHVGLDQPTIHSKLAIFDDEYLVCGTSNWTYRSMQYDGEIATFNHCPVSGAPSLVTEARDRLLAHYDEVSPIWMSREGDNFVEVAHHNLEGIGGAWTVPHGRFILVPLFHPRGNNLGTVREVPGLTEMPSYQWI